MKLTVVMLDTNRTTAAICHENEWLPYGRRTVQIQLTPEQEQALRPRQVGVDRGKPVFEVMGLHWLEAEDPALDPTYTPMTWDDVIPVCPVHTSFPLTVSKSAPDEWTTVCEKCKLGWSGKTRDESIDGFRGECRKRSSNPTCPIHGCTIDVKSRIGPVSQTPYYEAQCPQCGAPGMTDEYREGAISRFISDANRRKHAI